MRDLYSKTNAPYLIAGAVATLVLLASGTLAVAPYVAFLSPIAAFNVALPVALSLSILSTLILALSCKMISNNKKIEVEKNKFAEKEQELESVKQQSESKAQQKLDGAIKELSDKNSEIQELKSEIENLDKKIQELRIQNTEPSAKVEDQLKHREEMLSFEHQELRDENTRLNERVDSLIEELFQPQREIDSLKRQLDELKDKGILAPLLKERITELETCLEKSRKKAEELAVQLRKEKGETSCLQSELGDVVKRERRLKEKLSEKAQETIQLAADLEQKEKLCKELEEEKTENLDKIGKLKKLLDQERKGNEKLRDNNSELKSSEKYLGDECSKLRRHKSDLERKVERLQAVIGQEDEQSHSISSDISSEHLSELEGIGENESVNKQFPKPKPPYISTPIRSPCKKLNDASCDSGYSSGCFTSTNS
ncbi:coiled-coil domain-containing protein [Wolbachia endosymbiont (group A) of Lasioglossum morio]|uniref:hypothetical protein n=2 Tax=Wolbachia TaxID=953 RepID=UPI00223196D6|nr:hypothetical protein [Wolbachia endosymbiont (group A) of Lasioglossum morio]